MTVEEAMNRIGFTEAYKMVGLVAAGQVLEGDLELYGISTDYLWESCVLTATLMQYLAPRIKTPKDYSIPISGVAYTIGLLHQVGRILINHYNKKAPFSCLEGFTDKLTPSKEKELFGFDNFEAGAALLKKWNFSHEITVPIHYQNNPLDAKAVDGDIAIISLINLCRDAIQDMPRNLIKKDARIL
jgi:HD-like signal output (HDOD) protein